MPTTTSYTPRRRSRRISAAAEGLDLGVEVGVTDAHFLEVVGELSSAIRLVRVVTRTRSPTSTLLLDALDEVVYLTGGRDRLQWWDPDRPVGRIICSVTFWLTSIS